MLKLLGRLALLYLILNIVFPGTNSLVERRIYDLHGKHDYESFDQFKQKGVLIHRKQIGLFFPIGGCVKYEYFVARTPPEQKTENSRLKYYESCIGHWRFKILGKMGGGPYRFDAQGRLVPLNMEYDKNGKLQKIRQSK